MQHGNGNMGFNGPPGESLIVGARNGLSVDSLGFVVLGNDGAQPGNPAQLLGPRQIVTPGNYPVSYVQFADQAPGTDNNLNIASNQILIRTESAQLQTDIFAAGIVFDSFTQGFHAVLSASVLQISLPNGLFQVLPGAGPGIQSTMQLVGDNPDSVIQLGSVPQLIQEDPNGIVVKSAVSNSNFLFDTNALEFKIFQSAPVSQAGSVIAGKAISQPIASTVNLNLPGDEGRVITNEANTSAASITINVPAGKKGAFFDVHLVPHTVPANVNLTIRFTAGDIPGRYPSTSGTSGGTIANATAKGGTYIRVQCFDTPNGLKSNWSLLILDGSGLTAGWVVT